MNRTKIENILMEMGTPAGTKGFNYIADAVEYIDENGTDISVTKELYPEIAKKRNTTSSRVERAIRHALNVTRGEKGNYDVVEKYLGFIYCTNYSSLVMLHSKIKQEDRTEETTDKAAKLEIREIIRQELMTMLNELKGA